MPFGHATEQSIESVVRACERHGMRNIVVLWGPPGTGKSYIALAAAQRFTGHELLVQSVQFHQSYSYEDFVEGYRPVAGGGFEPHSGVFQDWNDQALADPENRYVLLIEELSRANLSAVLGELLTYVEYRDRTFTTPIRRRELRVAENLVFVATMNPRDRSALELDDALIRRLRIIKCLPSGDQLDEMLRNSLEEENSAEDAQAIIDQLKLLFNSCQQQHPDTYEEMMPFGHGIFAGIRNAEDLRELWNSQLHPMLRRPNVPSHPFFETIRENYPWRE